MHHTVTVTGKKAKNIIIIIIFLFIEVKNEKKNEKLSLFLLYKLHKKTKRRSIEFYSINVKSYKKNGRQQKHIKKEKVVKLLKHCLSMFNADLLVE